MNNRIIEHGDLASILIEHFGDEVRVIIDRADVEKAQAFRWCIGEIRDGYRVVMCSARADGRQVTVKLARHLLDAPRGLVVDHINRDPLDNRRANLRVISVAANNQNVGVRKDSQTGVRGVHRRGPSSYRATAQVAGRQVRIGTYRTLEEAAAAAAAWRAAHQPFAVDCPGAAAHRKGGSHGR